MDIDIHGTGGPTRLFTCLRLNVTGLLISTGEKMFSRLLRLLAPTAVLLIAVWAGTPDAAAEGAVKSVHGDWQVRCDSPPGSQENQCALVQSVAAEDRPDVGLTIIVVANTEQKSTLLRVLAPMGVLLPAVATVSVTSFVTSDFVGDDL